MRKSFYKTTSRPLPKLLLGLLFVLTLALVLQACGSGDGADDRPQPTPNFVAPTPRSCPADDTDNAEPVDADVFQLACDNSNFAFDLYRALRDEEGNLFFSPFSISQVMAMAYAGAREETERQMADALRYTLPHDRLHPAFIGLDSVLRSRSEDSYDSFDPDGESTAFRLNISNAVWGQDGFKFHGDYLNTLKENYEGELRRLDFTSDPEESRNIINEWVAGETEDKIKDLMPQGSIDSFTRLVLTNAIYFNGGWRNPFFEEGTEDRPFYLLDDKKIEVPMMTGRSPDGLYRYARGKGFQSVQIPYATYAMSMIAFLPDKGKLSDLENSMNAGNLDQIEWEGRDVTLNMPRFEFGSQFSLKGTLAGMGMPDAFSEGIADFSGMTDEEALFISVVVHKAFVSVDEEGTEAAAATGGVARPVDASTPPPLEPITVTFDRPFIFLIRDEPTGTILFVGRVMDPTPTSAP